MNAIKNLALITPILFVFHLSMLAEITEVKTIVFL